jgi:hypothetical protein
MKQVYLSRRNLLTLLAKLDRNRDMPGSSQCTIIKNDNNHPKYPQSMKHIQVTAVEDEDYYVDRPAGEMHPLEEAKLAATSGGSTP